MPSPFDPQLGLAGGRQTMAGRYRLGAEIARGGFGTVYHATPADGGAACAVKVLHSELFSDPQSTLRFEREAAVVLAVPHPNIVKVYECGHLDGGLPYIAMELLHGESLEERLKRLGTLPPEEVLGILWPLAGALTAVHSRGIVHRDIKPSNVFLAEGRPEGSVVLLDFGIAKLLAAEGPALTASRTTLGTIPFMAPEQVRGEPVDIRTDVYALAAVAYAMLTGKPPFGAQITAILRQIHLHARPKPPSELAPIDPAIDAPILAALARDPNERPAGAEAFIAALRAAVLPVPSSRGALPVGGIERPAVAVFAEARPDPAALAARDETLFDALEASLTILRAELSGAGLIALGETATTLLAVSSEAPSAGLCAAVIAACTQAYRRIFEGPARGCPIELGIAIHAGALHTSDAGAILPSGLMDARSWSPAGLRGVAASRTALAEAGPDREPASGVGGFCRLCY